MGQVLYGSICIIIGLIIFYRKPRCFFFYWFLFEPILLPIGCLFLGVVSRDDLADFYKFNNNCARNLLVIVFLIEFFKKNKIPKVSRIWISLFVLMLYLIIHNAINHFDIGVIWGYFSQLISLTLVLLIILIDKQLIPTPKQITRFLTYFILFQLVFVIANNYGIYVYLTYYIPEVTVMPSGALIESFSERLAMGTFQSFNSLANFLTTIFLFVSLEFFSGKRQLSLQNYIIISVVIGVMIVFTGARASLVLFFLIIILSNLSFIKHNSRFFMFGSILFLLSLVFVMTFDTYGINESENGVNRSLVGLSNFFDTKKDEDLSTVSQSTYLLDNYFWRSPFIGNGIAYKGEFAYGNKGVVSLTGFAADSRLAFILVEYGFIGFLLYMYFFITVFFFPRSMTPKSDQRKLYICFIYFFILTITENGFFDRYNISLFFIYTYSFLATMPIMIRKYPIHHI